MIALGTGWTFGRSGAAAHATCGAACVVVVVTGGGGLWSAGAVLLVLGIRGKEGSGDTGGGSWNATFLALGAPCPSISFLIAVFGTCGGTVLTVMGGGGTMLYVVDD